jgi:hypothetical protein
MKRSTLTTSLVLSLAVLLTTSVFAAAAGGSLKISDPATVGGKQLAPGEYKVKWEGTGDNIQVSILKGKDVVATVPARMRDLNQSSNVDAAVVRKNDDGSRSLSEIRFYGKKFALSLGEESAKANSPMESGSTSK